MNSKIIPRIGRSLIVAILYFAGAELGLSLAASVFVMGAMKFHQRVVTTAIVLMAGVAVWGAKQGYGPIV